MVVMAVLAWVWTHSMDMEDLKDQSKVEITLLSLVISLFLLYVLSYNSAQFSELNVIMLKFQAMVVQLVGPMDKVQNLMVNV